MFRVLNHSTTRFFAEPMTRLVTPQKEIPEHFLPNLASGASVLGWGSVESPSLLQTMP